MTRSLQDLAFSEYLLGHVTSSKAYDFCMFSKFINFAPIDLTIGTHIDWTYIVHGPGEPTGTT